MNKEEIERLKREDILYDKTQKFGGTQFVRELATLEQENKQLKSKWLALETYIKDRIRKTDNIYGYFEESLDTLKEIKAYIDKLEKGE